MATLFSPEVCTQRVLKDVPPAAFRRGTVRVPLHKGGHVLAIWF